MKKQLIIVLFMWFGIASAMEDSGVLTNSWVTVPKAENQQGDDNEPSSFSSSSGYASADDYQDHIHITENPCFGMVVSLRRSLDIFEQNLYTVLQQAPEHQNREILDAIQEIETQLQNLSHVISQEKETRLHTGKQCAAHDEITALFNISLNKLHKVAVFLGTPEHTDNQVRRTMVAGSKLTETLHLFFGMIENHRSVYELCTQQAVMPLILKRVIKKPTHIDAVAQRLFSCWIGPDSMVRRYQQDVYPHIQECAQAMERIYDRVGGEDQELSEHVKRLKKEIDDVHFSIYQNSRQYLNYADLLRRISEGQYVASEEGESYRNAQILERTLEDEREQEDVLEARRRQLIRERDNVYRNIFGQALEEIQDGASENGRSSLSSSAERSSATSLSVLLKSVISLDLVRNFVSDLRGELVLKTGKRACLMADLADRLQTGDQVSGVTNQATKIMYGRLLHFLYRGIECGYQHASEVAKAQEQLETVSAFMHNLPENYENHGAGLVRVAQMTKNGVDWTKFVFTAPVRGVAAGFRYVGNLFSQEDRSDRPQEKEKEKVSQESQEEADAQTMQDQARKFMVCSLSKDGGQTVDHIKEIVAQMIDPASRFATEHRREIISLSAFAHMFESMADPRARNIGCGQFRHRFDQFAAAWNVLEDADIQSGPSDDSVEEEGLRRRR